MNAFEQGMTSIVEALNAFEQLLAVERPTDLAAFVRGRICLSRRVAEFLTEEWNNLPQNLLIGSGDSRPDLMLIHNAFVRLRADYSQHIGRWDSTRIVQNWSDYRADCQHLIRSMRDLVRTRSNASQLRAA